MEYLQLYKKNHVYTVHLFINTLINDITMVRIYTYLGSPET